MDGKSVEIILKKLKRSGSSSATLELPPIIDASKVISACSLHRKSRMRVVQSIRQRVAKVRPLTLPKKLSPVSDKSKIDVTKFAKRCKVPGMSRFLERDIRKRIKARALEFKHPKLLDAIMFEVREDYMAINNHVSLRMKTKLPKNEQLDTKILPYKYLGKTDRYSEYLRITRIFKRKWLLHNSLLRKILEKCVTNLPQVLIKFPSQCVHSFKIDEFQGAIHQEINEASLFLKDFYRTIVKLLEDDTVCIREEDLHRYYGACTGLLTLHLSMSIAHTILHIVDFTSCDKLVPYLLLFVAFENTAIVSPAAEEIINIYTGFITALLDMGNQFYALQRVKLSGYSSKRINLYITEEFICECKEKIRINVTAAYEPITYYVDILNSQFHEVYGDVSCADNNLFSDIVFTEGYEKIIHYKKFMLEIFNVPSKQYFQIGCIILKRYAQSITSGLKLLMENIFQKLALQHLYEVNDINEIFSMISYRAHKTPKTTEELIEIMKYMVWVKEEFLDQLTSRVYSALTDMVKLITLGPLSEDHMNLNSAIKRWLDRIQPIIDQNYQTFDQLKFEAEENLQRVIEEVNDDVKKVYPLLEILNNMDDMNSVKTYLRHIISHVMMIKEIEAKIAWINQEEVCLSFPKSTYKEYENLKNHVYPFYHLLKLCLNIKRSLFVWQDGQFEFLCHNATKSQLQGYETELQQIQKIYRNKFRQSQDDTTEIKFKGTVDDPDILNWPAPLKLCHAAKQAVENFKPSLDIMKIMCNPTLKKRHWIEMSIIAGFNVQPDAGTTLKKLMNIDYGPDLTKYETISNYATREAKLLEQLNSMETEWLSVEFRIEYDQNIRNDKLVDFERIEDVISEHLIQISNMKRSVYVTPHKTTLQDFDNKLNTVSKTISECILVQDRWLQLLPIFLEEKLASKMRQSADLFSQADTAYKGDLKIMKASPNVMRTASDGRFLCILLECTRLLEEVYSGVRTYIETQRLHFPRLHFLTDDQLIELMSKMDHLLLVQPYVNKLFPSVAKLTFHDSVIFGIESSDGEKIVFEAIDVEPEKGSVEKWLRILENRMKITISNAIRDSLNNYPSTIFTNWIDYWPGHVTAIVLKIIWTSKIHSSLCKQKVGALLPEADDIISKLSEIMKTSNQTNAMREKLKTLMISNINTKNIVNELIEKKVEDESHFSWIGQLRYYLNDDNCDVKLLNASFVYDNEYVDNSGRLIMTPLTERCYRTVFGAFHMHLYASPLGPAGTGKTETIKDLAKALGVLCIVFSCSKSMDYETVARFIRGTASSGAWLALDEFNRITIEILSAIYQSIYTLQLAIKSKLSTLVIDKLHLTLNRNCFICITMNPGYPGRSELPENLKSLFRNVAMMVPDSLKISEVSLISYGYVNAKELSTKLVASFKYMSEMFSSERHYDFGIRSLKAVLSKCDEWKRMHGDIEETLLVSEAVRETIAPRIVSDDSVLFEDILADIYTTCTTQIHTDDFSRESASISCRKNAIHLSDILFLKVKQAHLTVKARKGIIVVGDTASGKSTIIKMLANILTDQENTAPITCNIINPKTMTLEQLYGQYNIKLQRWMDGVISKCFRKCAHTGTSKWIIFDGPIDTVWVENLNSVLDDNQKLCLSSGETIDVNENVSLIFETTELKDASPATVSRCGIIHTETDAKNWEWILESWIENCNEEWCHQNLDYIRSLCKWVIPASLGTTEVLAHHFNMSATNLVKTFIRLFQAFMSDAVQANNSKDDVCKNIRSWIQASVIQACMWSFTSTLNPDSMVKFDELFRTLWKGQNNVYPYSGNVEKMDVGMPPDNTVYDSLYLYKQRGAWKNWSDLIKTEKISESLLSQEVLIPTVNLAKLTLFLDIHVRNKLPVLFIGPSGCGKTATIQDFLIHKLDTVKYEASSLSITFNMTVNEVQQRVLSKLKKVKAGLYGPSNGKSFILFVDDLNVTTRDEYGVKTVLELLRQHLDHNVWYDFATVSPIELTSVTLLTAFTLNNFISDYARLLRHFSIFTLNQISMDVSVKIYSGLLQHCWRKNGFPADVATTINQMVHATSDFYRKLVTDLKPTIDYPLYKFSMFDFNKAIKGCILLRRETTDADKKIFVKLWVHEMFRVFGDRITTLSHREWFAAAIRSLIERHFHEDVARILTNVATNEEFDQNTETADFGILSRIMFLCRTNDEKEMSILEEISISSFEELLTSYLAEYNEKHAVKMNIIFFEKCIMDILKIAHKLSLPRRNALLIGMSSVGRKTASIMASLVMKQKIHEPIMVNKYSHDEWRKQMKNALVDAGARMIECVFLLDSFRVEQKCLLNDLDYILKADDIETIFDPLEQQNILDLTRQFVLKEKLNLSMSASSIFLYFNKKCKENLHVLLCLSSVNFGLQKTIHKYPSLSKYCDKIVFEDWTSEGFHAVAKCWLQQVNLHPDIEIKVIEGLRYMHRYSEDLSKELEEQYGMRNYITNIAFLELVKTYVRIITEKQGVLCTMKNRYNIGLDKLSFASVQIEKMQESLAEYQPKLEEMTERAREMTEQIALESAEVEKVSALVKIDENVANEQAIAANILKLDCEAELAQAIPILEDAISALNTLKPSDITLVKSMKNPPDAIKLVMAAVCVIKDVKPDRIPDPSTGRKTVDYWGPSKRILGDMNFLQTLKDFDKDNIKPEIMVKIRKEYLPHKDFQPHIVAKASSAAEGLCKWIIAMDMYDKVAKEVAPKKEKLEKAEAEYAQTLAILNEKKEEVARIEAKLVELNSSLEEAERQQQILQREVDLCNKRLKRAQILMSGLGGEKERWINVSDKLQEHCDNLAGDILISCGIISYLASFPRDFREETIYTWHMSMKQREIPCSVKFDFAQVIGSETVVQKWHINNLPQDQFFVEDAIIHQHCCRWPLFLDPQFLARKWIEVTEKRNDLRVATVSVDNVFQIVKESMQSGNPVIIEGINEELGLSLENVLSKNSSIKDNLKSSRSSTECSKDFRLYFLSHTKNPQFDPDIFSRLHIINFSLTKNSLAGIILNSITEIEYPKMKHREDLLNVETMENGKKLKATEEIILLTLSESKADILEDERALKILDESKNISHKIRQEQESVKQNLATITTFKQQYKQLGDHVSVVYETISELYKVNLMYQYSLQWCLNILIDSVRVAERSKLVEERCEILKHKITFDLFTYVTRSLHVRDRVPFAFLLCVKLNVHYNMVSIGEINFLVEEYSIGEQMSRNKTLLKPRIRKVLQMVELDRAFEDFYQSIIRDPESLKTFVEDPNFPNCDLPFEWYQLLSPFKRTLIKYILKPDETFSILSQYVRNQLGPEYMEPVQFNLSLSYNQSNALCPLIFLLSRDTSDPMNLLLKFAKLKNMSHKLHTVSLGSGQEIAAKKIVLEGREKGYWICFQNCHLAPKCMQELKAVFDGYNYENTHANFRLWLTTGESKDFPVSFLQNGIKMVNEPPSGVKENILQTYTQHPVTNASFFAGCPGKDDIFHRLLFSVALFHAVIEERRAFGPIGWNIPYQFRPTDFHSATKNLQKFLNKYERPFEGLQYVIGECDYGGRVSDDWDQRLINVILKDFLSETVSKVKSYTFHSGYGLPRKNDYHDYIVQIQNMPTKDHPELFGLHENVDSIRISKKSGEMMQKIKILFSNYVDNKTLTGCTIQSIVTSIKSLLSDHFQCQKVSRIKNSSEAIMVREIQSYEMLHGKIESSLQYITDCINGESVLNEEMEEITNSLISYEIPKAWLRFSYPTVRNLSDYLEDLSKRLTYISELSKTLDYNNIWFPVLYFPHAYLAMAKKDLSNIKSVSLDQTEFSFDVDNSERDLQGKTKISGLFIEGAGWNMEKKCLDELPPKLICVKMPSIILDAREDIGKAPQNKCEIPVYRIFTRRGVISTSGHSTNYIFPISLDSDRTAGYWIKRGVALLCQIRSQNE